jgi:hypothetical protein
MLETIKKLWKLFLVSTGQWKLSGFNGKYIQTGQLSNIYRAYPQAGVMGTSSGSQ